MSADEKRTQSDLIQSKLKNIMSSRSGLWGAYNNLSDEPQILWSQVSESVQWVFPKVTSQQLQFRKAATEFEKSELGVEEPIDGEIVHLSDIQGFVIPGVAYDKNGFRLGRGKGFYDRSLQNFKGLKIGVCFEDSLCEEIPSESHDIKCDQIVTPHCVYQVDNSEGVEKWS